MICNRKIANIATSESGITPINGKIYWHVDENFLSPDLEKYKIIFAIQKSFNKWQPYVNPVFESSSNPSNSAIIFKFMEDGNPALPFPFDENTLAYAFFPNGQSLGVESDIYVNDAYNWSEMHTPSSFNLFKVIVHEIGHSLGLDHSENIEDILYPSYQPDDNVVVTDDTIEGIERLYGAKLQVDSNLNIDCDELLKSIFSTKRLLGRLYEHQLVDLANLLGINAKVSDLKADTLDKVYDKINN